MRRFSDGELLTLILWLQMTEQQHESTPREQPLLERRTWFGISFSLLILFVFFFAMPFAFRAARLSLNKKENDVKDWLPSDFVETAELEWFAEHFAGESFVIATWPGCNAGDQRLKLLESKLRHECKESDPAADIEDPELAEDYRSAKEYGIRLGLLPASRDLENWGGRNEKWLVTADEKWYFITPNGHLHRWEGKSNGPAGLVRGIQRAFGNHQLQGTFVAAFGPEKTTPDRPNPFHNDPSLLCAPMFHSVETGVSLVNELAREDGPLWPVDLTDQSRRAVVARRRAMERLTGSLFAAAVPPGFDWTPEAFRSVLPENRRDRLPEDFDRVVEVTLYNFAEEHFDGNFDRIDAAHSDLKTAAWYAVFDAAEVEPPPRQTALLITLTDIAKDNLAYALGRGVLGGPRGRLLELAADSGVQPPAPPSVAPPPFNKKEVESIGGAPPLRLGGPPVDNVAIDEEGTVTLVRLVGYSVLVGIVLSYLCFGSFKMTVMVFIVGGSAAMLSMAFVSWTDGHVDAVLMSMPSLVYVLGLSGAIHVVNYYRDEVRRAGRSGAAGRALRHALFPCSLAALTTAIGLGSLYTSNLAPISNFGLYAAIGVVATLAILFSYLPAALQAFITESSAHRSETVEESARTPETWLSDRWAALGRWICHYHLPVTIVCLLAMVGIGIGLTKIKTSVQLLKLFDSQARIIRDYAWLETNFGKLVPMELVLRIPPGLQSEAETEGDESNKPQSISPNAESLATDKTGIPLNLLERVEAVSRINYVVEQTLGEPGLGIVGKATSADTFLPPLPGSSKGYSPIRSHFTKQLNESRQELLENDYVRHEQLGPYVGSELWRISLRVDALSDVDYGGFISTLRTAVEPVLRAYDTRDALLQQLAENGKPLADHNPVVLLVGTERPQSLADTQVLRPRESEEQSFEELILTRSIYLATLGELLENESLRRALWLDPNAPDNSIEPGSDKWNKLLNVVDAVVWVGDEPQPESLAASVGEVVDGTAIFSKPIEYALTEDETPEVVNSGALQVVYTGVVPVVYKAQRTLLGSLVQSIGMAFVLIAIVMVVLLNPARRPQRMLLPRRFAAGALAGAASMVPNVFPVVVVFGAMGHLGRLVDIGTMMTASVAMGVAVDDTIHFLSWFRSYLDQGYQRVKAIELTYRRVGPAMTQTTIVGGIGLFVFALSTFTPTQRFGTLMLVLLATALIGDLIMLPALLAGPLGRFFKPREGSPADRGCVISDESETEPETIEAEANPAEIDKEKLPQLRLHSPSRRADRPHRMKGR
jgi:predicted RND superfamily exporter protein